MYPVLRISVCLVIVVMSLGMATFTFGQTQLFQRTLVTNLKDAVILNVAVSQGNVRIAYSRDDQVAVYAFGKDGAGRDLPEEFFKNNLIIEQKDNRVWIRDSIGVGPSQALLGSLYTMNYRIDVPYRTEVESTVSGRGNQKLMGVAGPAKLISGAGDIEAIYVRFAPLQAATGKGNISCSRDFQVTAETGEGNITLLENGTSKAVVKTGRGKIEVGGARGSFEGSTDTGPLHVKAIPQGDWQLKSASGNIHVELPAKSGFEVDASTISGEISIERDDMQKPDSDAHQFHQQVNGGGKSIAMRSVKGSIIIQ